MKLQYHLCDLQQATVCQLCIVFNDSRYMYIYPLNLSLLSGCVGMHQTLVDIYINSSTFRLVNHWLATIICAIFSCKEINLDILLVLKLVSQIRVTRSQHPPDPFLIKCMQCSSAKEYLLHELGHKIPRDLLRLQNCTRENIILLIICEC